MDEKNVRWQSTVFREKLAFYLEDIETPTGRIINLFITTIILISCLVFVAETYPLPPDIQGTLHNINTATLIIFALEYLLRLWCAESKLKFIFSSYALIDLIVILPLILRIVDISFLRIFRWFRVLRLLRFLDKKTLIFGKISPEDSLIVARILFTLIAIIFVFSGLIYQVEHPVNPQTFATFFDAVYFSVVTMTTVGFGDVTPISQAGRLMTVLMILTGIALIPWQLGDLIKQFLKTANQVKTRCSGCGLAFHDADAFFCKQCGAELKNSSVKIE